MLKTHKYDLFKTLLLKKKYLFKFLKYQKFI